MTGSWQVRVYDNKNLVYSGDVNGALEIGRQGDESEKPFSQRWRVVIAPLTEDNVSRRHALLEPVDDGRLRVTNVSARQPIRLPDGNDLKPNASCEVSLPTLLTFGKKTIRIQRSDTDRPHLESLLEATRTPGGPALVSVGPLASISIPASGASVDVEALIRWLQTTMSVLQSAANSQDFFPQAAKAIVDIAGLNSGLVLILEEGTWKVQAAYVAPHAVPEKDWRPSQQVLSHVRQEKRTFWEKPARSAEKSLLGVSAVVAAPILNPQGEVIGALYGDRRQDSQTGLFTPITHVEAMLVELLAGGVAAGLARLEQEKAALAARVQFEQFFTAELAHQLATRSDMLQGRDAEVTILFCDIRGFSRISERLGPAKTVNWISDILGALSDCVLAHRGVVVDYIGDALMAMWGAPEEQPDHAQLACRGALAMLERVPQLNELWQGPLQEPLELGIGLNTGMARVGNIGTPRKFKYGALGNTVNLASRVQGATKYLKCNLLATEATHKALGLDFHRRRLCTVRVVNIAEAVDLYEVVTPGQPGWPEVQALYEKALHEFEDRQFRVAARSLAGLAAEAVNDGPALVLLARAVNALVEGPSPSHPVWELPGK